MWQRVFAAVTVAALLVAPAPQAPASVPAPETLCTVTDPRLTELSGLAVVGETVWAVADGGRRVDVYQLNPRDCRIVGRRHAAIDPYDVEDLAVGPDGALWVADIGDNALRRDSVAVIVLPATGSPRLHRLTYPDGPHDAEALLVDRRGVPYVITKEAVGPAGVYRAVEPPVGVGPTPLVHAGSLVLPASDTSGGPIGSVGSRTITGAAATADGSVVAVRTYTDAWVFPVPDGDIAAALAGTPTQVPLPGEPQGEAVAFTADGTLLSGSETRRGVPGELRAVPGVAPPVESALQREPAAAHESSADPADEPDTLPSWLPAAVGAAAVSLLLLLVAALAALRRRF